MTAPGSTEWINDLSEAIKRRDRALTGVARWQRALDAAEAEIARLAGQTENTEPAAVTPPTEAPVTEEPVTEPAA